MRDNLFTFTFAAALQTDERASHALDLGAATVRLGDGVKRKFVEIRVTQDFNTCTSAQWALQDSADDSDFATLVSGPVVLRATLNGVNYKYRIPVPDVCRRYIRLFATVAGTPPTEGNIAAAILTE